MEQDLISKKELLQKYGISYGALYRWKRKGLIPEDWFQKQSAVTGQETFFPRELVCQRVELILSQKEELSLDALSALLGQAAKKEAVLILQTAYGEKKFYVSDLRAVILDRGDGTPQDLTQLILGEQEKLDGERA